MPAAVEPSARRFAVLYRPIAVFVLAFVGLAILAGERLARPSGDNHFVHMADGWLHGRLALPGKPPGFCEPARQARGECRGHRFDDYAVVWELKTDDGRTLRGYPCRTRACAEARRRDRTETWWIVGEGWQSFARGEVKRGEDTWYVTFPPGPALVMVPLVAVWGTGVWDVLVTVLLGALVPALLVAFLDGVRGTADGRGREHLVAAFAWTFASPACFLAANGRVWFTAQICGALAIVAYISAAWQARAPMRAGTFLAAAIACRPANMVFATPIFLVEWWRDGRKPGALLRFASPLVVTAVVLVWMNVARFEDPLESGHRYLEIRWQARMQEIGMFSTAYLARNLECILWLWPQLTPFRVSVHGMALWLSSPWILVGLLARDRFHLRPWLWGCALAMAIPSLLYQNSGQVQPAYRFAVDWLPLVLVAIVLGGGARRKVFLPLVLLAALANVWGAWWFARAPARLFVVDPPGWPYEAELEDS
jgi:hypothetical protein